MAALTVITWCSSCNSYVNNGFSDVASEAATVDTAMEAAATATTAATTMAATATIAAAAAIASTAVMVVCRDGVSRGYNACSVIQQLLI